MLRTRLAHQCMLRLPLPKPRPRRLAACKRLAGEAEVQAVCIDAACSNVEAHYGYISQRYDEFRARYDAQHAAHGGEEREGGREGWLC